MVERVLTGFSNLTDPELEDQAGSAVTGLTGNAAIVFTGTTFTDFVGGEKTFHDSMDSLATGGNTAVAIKDLAREALLPLYSAVAVVVNQQQAGNLPVLLTTGIKLAAHAEYHYQPITINFQMAYGVGSNMMASVTASPAGDHGTVFAFTPATNTNTDPNTWPQKTVNGHKATLTGLTTGTAYLFSAAYKGRDTDALIWSTPITKNVGN